MTEHSASLGSPFRPGHGQESPGYRMCSVSIMDTTDPGIRFDDNGVCDYVHRFRRRFAAETSGGLEQGVQFDRMIKQAKSRRGPYNVICGVSGGVDSSMVLVHAVRLGLKPLAVHVDNGWNHELAVANIEQLTRRLHVDLAVEVLDWQAFSAIQRSFFRASVPNVETPTDHAIVSVLFRFARKNRIPLILSGSNLATEGFNHSNAGHDNKDWVHIRSIHRQFGDSPAKAYPGMSRWDLLRSIVVDRVRFLPVLDRLGYDRGLAKQELAADWGWRDYGRKHGESVFTRFFQEHYLPTKFGIDKRKSHLSCQILAGQMTREDALAELAKPLWQDGELEEVSEYVRRKLRFDEAEWAAVMASEPCPHAAYPTDPWFRRRRGRAYQALRLLATGRGSWVNAIRGRLDEANQPIAVRGPGSE
jgi:N-acetyl sugar amidotransferase